MPSRFVRSGLAALALCAAGSAAAWAPAAPAPEIAWRTDLEAARAEAARTGQPLFVTFR